MNSRLSPPICLLGLVLSLALNAILLGRLAPGRTAPEATATAREAAPRGIAAPASAASAFAAEADTASLAAALRGSNQKAWIAALRRAGVSRNEAVALAWSRCNRELYFSKMAPLWDRRERLWWRDPYGSDWRDTEEAARNAVTAAFRSASALIEAEYGARDAPETLPSPPPSHAFLPWEKYQALTKLQNSYREEREQLEREVGVALPAERDARLALLRKEEESARAALLAPEELHELELRESPTAEAMREPLGQVDVTETEFRALYPLQKAFDERAGQSGGTELERLQVRTAALDELERGMAAVIGPERAAAYRAARDSGYRTLRQIAPRLGLSPDAVQDVYRLREKAIAVALADAKAGDSSPRKQHSVYARVAADTRAQLGAVLGEEVAARFLEREWRWVGELEQGSLSGLVP